MSIFSRIMKIGQAKISAIVNGLEKPEIMLEQAIKDKEKQIIEAKKSVQECIASERQTKALLEQERNQQLSWETRAETALKAGEEALAVKALARAKEHENKSNSLHGNWKQQRSSVEVLKGDIMRLDEELAEFRRNKDFILAQSKASEVKKQIYEAKAKIGKKYNADDLMARLKAKAERTSHEADAAEEIANTFEGKDSLEKEFDDLDGSAHDTEIQDKLAALKKKLGKNRKEK